MDRTVRIVALSIATAISVPATAEDLRLGVAIETTSIDPNFYNFPGNQQIADHMFDPLIAKDGELNPRPGLAVSWRPLDDKVWEFKLRPGVKWHDGSPFTADDVLFTHDYATGIKTSAPGRFQQNKTLQKIDDLTVHISAGKPYPLMPLEMSVVHVVSRKHGQGRSTEDYNTGQATVGTGPYRFVEWVKGDRLVMQGNPDHWGGKPRWDRVTFRPITAAPSRIAALLNRDVDFIDKVPTEDIAKLRTDPRVSVSETPSNRIIYLFPDLGRHISPYVLNNDGTPMFPNALRDWKVRKAISLAVNRQAIVERVMDGAALAAGQQLPPFYSGHNPTLKADPYEPDTARRLLAQAGYPDGFRLTLHATQGRNPNDRKVAEALAAMLTQVGIKTEVVTMPPSVFFSRAQDGGENGAPEFSISLYGTGSSIGDGLSQLSFSHATRDPSENMGFINHGRYSNPALDGLFVKAFSTMDTVARDKLVQEAGAIIAMDYVTIPLYWQKNTWALRPDLTYTGHVDEHVLAEFVLRKR